MTITEFLANIGLGQYADAFEENGIDVAILPELEEADLPDLGVKLLGHRKKLMKAIRLQGPSSKEMAGERVAAPVPSAAPVKSAPPAPAAKAPAPVAVPRPAPAPIKAKEPATIPQKPRRRATRQDLVSTIVEKATAAAGRAASAETEDHPAPSNTQRIRRLKRSSMGRIPAASQPGSTPAPVESTPADATPTRRKKKKSGFSETQWFMAGVKEDAEVLEAEAEKTDYDHDTEITETQRKAFTLREDEE